MSLYTDLCDAKIPMDHHESDLYVKVTVQSAAILANYKNVIERRFIKTFRHQVTQDIWYDIPFAYEPFWERKRRVTA